MATKPSVSVSIVAANYNNASYLSEFIESVQLSEVLPRELIIVDDGSTDHSLEELKKWNHLEYLIVIKFAQNKGFTAALNAGIERATSKYIMRADPDDVLLPERIGTQFSFMEKNPNLDIIGSNAIYFSNLSGKTINKTNFPIHHKDIYNAYRKGEHGFLHATVMVKREIFQQYLYQEFSPGEDYELFSRMLKNGCIGRNIKKPLYKVRVHPSSSTSGIKESDIIRTFAFRDKIFETKTNPLKIKIYYLHISHYRRSQLATNHDPQISTFTICDSFISQKSLQANI
ncbi:MAG: glycosyltransferase [Bacteroidales bacterium]|nr:glycosyltransferase [Bacteroidales bacterium]